jgi:hypothetical protein
MEVDACRKGLSGACEDDGLGLLEVGGHLVERIDELPVEGVDLAVLEGEQEEVSVDLAADHPSNSSGSPKLMPRSRAVQTTSPSMGTILRWLVAASRETPRTSGGSRATIWPN